MKARQRHIGGVHAALALAVLVVVAVLLIGPSWMSSRPETDPKPIQPARTGDTRPLTSKRVDEAVAAAAAYLVRVCDEGGRFAYRVNIDPAVEVESTYNIVRHAGTIYAMATYAQRHPNEAVLDAVRRAAGFMRREAVGPVEGHEGLLAVWSDPNLEHTDRSLRAQLGGTGLGLVGLVSLERVAPGTTPLEELRALGRFVLFMTEADGRTFTEYIPADGGRSDARVVLYYPGEAALGLVMLYELDPSPEWLDGAARILGYLAKQREGKRRVPPDHWALLATGRLLPCYERLDEQPVSRQALVRHAVQICEGILRARTPQSESAVTHGCFSASGATCSTATRLEGLLAALTFLDGDEHAEVRARIESAARDGVAFLVRAQMAEGPYAGGIPMAIARFPAGHPRYSEEFNASATEIRIDYVQHVMSAMMQYAGTVLANDTK